MIGALWSVAMPAPAAVPFTLTISGPATFIPGQPLSGPFTGTLSVAGVGVPSQTVEIAVDGQVTATSATTLQGTYAASLPPLTGLQDRTVRATVYRGTVLETFAETIVLIERYSLDVTIGGSGSGSVQSSPAGITCPSTCSALFPATSIVTLAATPQPNSTFAGWSGACAGTGSCSISMDGARSVTATFVPVVYTLAVTKSGFGSGVVTSSPAGINCGTDCSELYASGTIVTLSASPSPGSIFSGWTRGGCSGTGTCTVNMTMSVTVTAEFTQSFQPLSVVRTGAGMGTVVSSPAGISCGGDCSEAYPYGTVVSLTATPASGSFFNGWSGGGCSGTGPCVVTMTTALSVVATFSPSIYVLSVSKAGPGSGTVTSSPAGINCGPDCSEPYNSGTFVTLTAAPSFLSTFTGWSGGGCSGTGSCTISMNASTTVTAFFN